MRGQLGCGQYECYILTRGGGEVVARFPWTGLSWQRVLDDTSDGSAQGNKADCCALIGNIRPWRHEIAIYRNGAEVWVGPLYNPTSPPDPSAPQIQSRIQARDLSSWWDHRKIHLDHDFSSPTDLAVIFQAYAEDAMQPDPSPGLTIAATLCGVLGVRKVLASQNQIAGLLMRDLANIGVDFTMIGREAMVGGSIVPATPIPTLTDDHFMFPPTPNLDGTEQANAVTLVGSGTSGSGGDLIYETASDADAAHLDGLLESVESDSTILDGASALAGAETRLALASSLVMVENAVLAHTAPVTVDQLIPGALCQLELELTCPPISGRFRLKQVDGAAGDMAGALDETISLTFQPVGTN